MRWMLEKYSFPEHAGPDPAVTGELELERQKTDRLLSHAPSVSGLLGFDCVSSPRNSEHGTWNIGGGQ